MARTSTTQSISTPAGETLVIMPLAEYEALRDALDAARSQSAAAAVARGDMETLTAAETRALVAAATPLAFWRNKRGITQADLAAKVGVTQGFVASLESGARKGGAALVLRLSRALRVPMESLVVEA